MNIIPIWSFGQTDFSALVSRSGWTGLTGAWWVSTQADMARTPSASANPIACEVIADIDDMSNLLSKKRMI
jgi:hypothetical protein